MTLSIKLKYYEDIEKKYQELIYHVGTKYHDETRHETALRYIRERESSIGTDSWAKNEKKD